MKNEGAVANEEINVSATLSCAKHNFIADRHFIKKTLSVKTVF